MSAGLVETKIVALLAAGSVTLLEVAWDRVAARVEGYHGTYAVGWNAATGWTCSCADQRRRCSHLGAVRRVVVANDRPVGRSRDAGARAGRQ